MSTDTYFSSIKSTRGNTCDQIWTNDIKWIRIDPMSTKNHAHHSANRIFNNNGVTSKKVVDSAREQIMGKFKEACQDAMIQVHQRK